MSKSAAKPPFKQMEVADVFTPENIATFERPHENNDTIVIRIQRPGDFHLDAGTLRVVAEVLQLSPSTKHIQ